MVAVEKGGSWVGISDEERENMSNTEYYNCTKERLEALGALKYGAFEPLSRGNALCNILHNITLKFLYFERHLFEEVYNFEICKLISGNLCFA
jgi:hypothetical protein